MYILYVIKNKSLAKHISCGSGEKGTIFGSLLMSITLNLSHLIWEINLKNALFNELVDFYFPNT